MKKNNIGYLLREGFRGVFLHGFMSFAAICVTVACLIIMGSFCLILYNTSALVKELEQENEMLVYIDESYSEAKAKSVGSQINLITNVRSATFVSRDQALDDFVETLNDPDAFAGLDPDTLRDRYVVTVEDNSLLKQTYDKLTQIEGVAEVIAHFEIAEGFQTVQNVLNIASLVIVTVLFVVSLFIISNTVKLAMYSRSEEIAIMKMVGATNAFIRLPFIVEGFIIGIIAAAAAFFLEWGLYDFVLSKIQQLDTLKLFVLVPFTDVIEIVAIAYALTGFLVGVFGSLLSIRKFHGILIHIQNCTMFYQFSLDSLYLLIHITHPFYSASDITSPPSPQCGLREAFCPTGNIFHALTSHGISYEKESRLRDSPRASGLQSDIFLTASCASSRSVFYFIGRFCFHT